MDTLLFVLLGWIVGILINRAADKLIARESLMAVSRCPHCGAPRPILDQVAVTGLFLFRNRCLQCGTLRSFRPLLVELASAAAFGFLCARYDVMVYLVLAAIYTAILLLVFVTDFESRFIFNIVMLPAIGFATVASPFSAAGLARSLLGGALAFVMVMAIYLLGKLFERVRGLSIRGGAFGQGDVTLSTFIGLITGFPFVINAIFLGILLGGAGAFVTVVYHALIHRRLALNEVIPYGPFLCIGGWVVMVFRL